uniref:Uncharacterized protein n=1 Tax=Chromera velia CCMP2878 TaxID=1169474 RepID=A0A0G4HUI8_9ALVE|eukprot:Cvel_31878.t1-p1 / transcript=Cvel_31878.t1 / gene=Cvel_31878 / organism=Chromera_velia_CCMP2878 / gene_product=hypothetical protein / transcript_product=hypothetical protein / location=Cvel_scaffold4836:4076-5093(+) / protein_length=122 / sequence_SO=supercontig / SO=protein_coding / is_pseudo=false
MSHDALLNALPSSDVRAFSPDKKASTVRPIAGDPFFYIAESVAICDPGLSLSASTCVSAQAILSQTVDVLDEWFEEVTSMSAALHDALGAGHLYPEVEQRLESFFYHMIDADLTFASTQDVT